MYKTLKKYINEKENELGDVFISLLFVMIPLLMYRLYSTFINGGDLSQTFFNNATTMIVILAIFLILSEWMRESVLKEKIFVLWVPIHFIFSFWLITGTALRNIIVSVIIPIKNKINITKNIFYINTENKKIKKTIR